MSIFYSPVPYCIFSQNLLFFVDFRYQLFDICDLRGSGRLCNSIAASVSYLALWSDNNHLLANVRARGHWSWWIFLVEQRATSGEHSTVLYYFLTRLGLDTTLAALVSKQRRINLQCWFYRSATILLLLHQTHISYANRPRWPDDSASWPW